MSRRCRTPILLALILVQACRTAERPEALFEDATALATLASKEHKERAAEKFRLAMDSWAASGNHGRAIGAARALGRVTFQLGLVPRAAESYDRALKWAVQAGDTAAQGEISSELGAVRALLADGREAFEAASRHCDRALSLARVAQAHRQIARAVQCLGDVAYYRQDGEEAVSRYQESLRLLESTTDVEDLVAEGLLSLGHAASDLGRFEEAESSFARAREIWERRRDERQSAITDVGLGRLYLRRGEYQRALGNFETASSVLKRVGDALWQGSAAAGIAEVLLELGDPATALNHWEHARAVYEAAGLDHIAIDTLMAIGENHLAAGDGRSALVRFEAALVKAEALGIDRWKAYALRLIGVAHLSRSMPLEARGYLERALALQNRLGASGGYRLQARLYNELGEVHRLLANHPAAGASFERALAMSRVEHDRVTEATTLYAMARSADDRNDLQAARNRIAEALAVAESLRSDVLHRELRASYVSSIYRWYELQVDLLMRLHARHPTGGFARAAFEASERARARTLLDGIADRELDLRVGVSAELLAREQRVLQELAAWASDDPDKAPVDDVPEAAQKYRQLEYRYDHIQGEIRRTSPAYMASSREAGLSLHDVQQDLLDTRTWLVEYFLGTERSYVWVISRNGFRYHELPSRETIENLAVRLYERMSGRPTSPADRGSWDEGRRLADILLGPLGPIPPGQRLLVVADGALHYLPFAALPIPDKPDEGLPLLTEHEVISVPSASALRAGRRARRVDGGPPRLAVLADPVFDAGDPRLGAKSARPVRGDALSGLLSRFWGRPMSSPVATGTGPAGALQVPRLVATRTEAEAILRIAGGAGHLRALDFNASRATILAQDLGAYPIIHLASHSLFDNKNPGASGILLSRFDAAGRPQDGFVRLSDIYRLKLPVDMVVLSACSTALGEPVKGEGLVGVVRGFLHAGARRVVASHWKVDDEATGELMQRFYTELLHRGRSPSAALREAQLAMRRLERWSNPYHWAAFAVHGDW